MEAGRVVEYIDRQKITCAVVLEVKDKRLRLLTESNREVNLSSSRLSHKCKMHLNLSIGRHKMVNALKKTAARRSALITSIDIKELWEILNVEQEWIDLATMTELCFPSECTDEHESAVARAFFSNRLYFKFNNDQFFPYSEEQVEQGIAQEKANVRKDKIITDGSLWLKNILNSNQPVASGCLSDDCHEFIEIIKSYYLFDKESSHYALGKALLAKAGVKDTEKIFQALVKIGVFDKDENLELHRFNISKCFSDKVKKSVKGLTSRNSEIEEVLQADKKRKDLTGLSVMTIDSMSTLDFDDAISIENSGNHYRLGIHIIDVGHFIKKGDVIDQEAFDLGSSIYMPDNKIPMLPPFLAENLCSLKTGEIRPAISVMVNINKLFEIIDYEIFPSIIKVKNRYSYYDVNIIADKDSEIIILHEIAKKFRQYRMDNGAVQITLPEINVWLNDDSEIIVNTTNRESPGRMMVAEIMIMANWIMGGFMAKNNVPAIFRTQPAPRERLYTKDEGTLFQNYMQRKMLSRFVLDHEPAQHSGLGLDVYVTATSPIRRYFDLVTQRQLRAILGLEEFYTDEEVDKIILQLRQPIQNISKLQYSRNRYWLLKYLEKKIGTQVQAVILFQRKDSYQVLITEYMIECSLPSSSAIKLNPEDLVRVTIQHVNARRSVFSVFMS